MANYKLQTIIHKSSFLQNYPKKCISPDVLAILSIHLRASVGKTTAAIERPLFNILECFLAITGKNLNITQIENGEINEIFKAFIGTILSKKFIAFDQKTTNTYISIIKKIHMSLQKKYDIQDLIIDDNECLDIWARISFKPDLINYYTCCFVTGKNKEYFKFFDVTWIWEHLGEKITRELHNKACTYFEGQSDSSLNNSLPLLNEFFSFIKVFRPKITISEIKNLDYVEQIINDFLVSYFERDNLVNNKRKKSNCLLTLIKRWNDARFLFNYVLFESGTFGKPLRGFPYLPPKRKVGDETNISINNDGITVKSKLMTDIPLHLTDDKAIEKIIEEIKLDFYCIVNWAEEQSKKIVKSFRENNHVFDFNDFDLDSAAIRKKYKIREKKGETLTQFSEKIGMASAYQLEPYMYLLIAEHNEITDSFLVNLKMFGKNGDIIGLEITDNHTYLVGDKNRRGSALAEQKIPLNENSLRYINEILEITQPLRKYLLATNNKNCEYLFLSSAHGFSKPKKISELLAASEIHKKSVINKAEQLKEFCNKTEKERLEFVVNCSLTKFRATAAIIDYFKTESTSKMSNKLGHAKYKPELLSSYLPESILRYFDSRWIRIFQKSIICEALKDSPFLYKATKFKTMEELNLFIENHVFQRHPNEDNQQELDNDLSIAISINTDHLSILLSLKEAVDKSKKMVSPKAAYWASFTTALVNEIENNLYDTDLLSCLSEARASVDHTKFSEVIYA